MEPVGADARGGGGRTLAMRDRAVSRARVERRDDGVRRRRRARGASDEAADEASYATRAFAARRVRDDRSARSWGRSTRKT